MSQSPQSSNSLPPVPLLPTLRLALQIAWQASPTLLLCLVVLTVLTGTIPPIVIQINAKLLSLLAVNLAKPMAFDLSIAMESAVVFLLQLAAVQIGGQVLTSLKQSLQTIYQGKVVMVIGLRLVEHASRLDLAFFDDPDFHNQLANASNEASFRPVMILDQLLSMGSSLITVGWVTVLIWQWHSWVVLIVVLIAVLRYGLGARQAKVHAALQLKQTPLQRTAQYLNMVLTGNGYAKEIRLFDLSSWLRARYLGVLTTLNQESRRVELRLLWVTLLAQPTLMIYLPVMFGFAVWQLLQRVISLGQFSLYCGAMGQLDGGCLSIITLGAQTYENLLFFRNLVSFLRVEPDVERPRPTPNGSLSLPTSVGRAPSIDFCDVTFGYPDAPAPILNRLTFHLDPGETAALVGMNGAGKTTVVKLLAGLYHPTSGRILIDGQDITTLDRRVLRAWLSVIFQDFAIYHWSAADNIAVGDIAFVADRKRVERAAERSGFANVVRRFSEGYDTVLGRLIERGEELSGGQRQLLALARALMREAPVLILDEPGAALDIENEEALFEQLLSAKRRTQQTIIFISHRFSTVRRASHILVLEDGRLLEEGTHDALMRRNGRYAGLFASQVRLYGSEQDVKGHVDQGDYA